MPLLEAGGVGSVRGSATVVDWSVGLICGGGGVRWEIGGDRHHESAWGDSDDASEVAGHMALVEKSDHGGDVGDGACATSEEFLCAVDPAMDQVLVGGESGGLFEPAGEVEWAEIGESGEGFQGDFTGQVGVDVFDDGAKLLGTQTSSTCAGLGDGSGVMADEVEGCGGGERLSVHAAAWVSRLQF